MLKPLPYHIELRDYLKTQEVELWNWFASAKAKADYAENLRLVLLKAAYRLDAEAHPELYQTLEEAKARLQIDIPVTLYQEQNNLQPNATLFSIPGQGHIVFSGPVFNLLNAEELKSVIGHELAHYRLWQCDNGEFHIADRIIEAVVNDPRASASHEQTARHYQLYTEIFADRGSFSVTDDIHPVVAGLVKIQTGLTQVSAASYLKQAEEVFGNDSNAIAAEGISHPETFIRARALELWQTQPESSAAAIARMIEGAIELNELDLAGQRRVTEATRQLLTRLLQPMWFQTPAVLGHARLFFADFQPGPTDTAALDSVLKQGGASMREYFCYVLLDFAKADPDLDDMPLVAALELSRQLEMDALFEKLAVKELKLKVRDIRKLKDKAGELLAGAEASHE